MCHVPDLAVSLQHWITKMPGNFIITFLRAVIDFIQTLNKQKTQINLIKIEFTSFSYTPTFIPHGHSIRKYFTPLCSFLRAVIDFIQTLNKQTTQIPMNSKYLDKEINFTSFLSHMDIPSENISPHCVLLVSPLLLPHVLS